jgi:hypothetical protein
MNQNETTGVLYMAQHKTKQNFTFSLVSCHKRNFAKLQSPHLRTPGSIRPFYITIVGGEPRVKHGVWHSEMWAQVYPFKIK